MAAEMMDTEDAFEMVQMPEGTADMMDTDHDIMMGKPHPLLIDHIVENIVHNLLRLEEDEKVLQYRLVCEVWDRIATKALRSHSNKTVYFGRYFRSPEALQDFTDSSSLANFPLGKFYLCEDIFRSCHLPTVKKFFSTCAPTLLTSLTIRLDNQSDLKVSELDIDKFSLPKLKTLVVDDRRSFTRDHIEMVTSENDNSNDCTQVNNIPTTLLEGFVKGSPNLQKLSVIHPPSSIFDEDETALTRRIAAERNVAQMLSRNCPRNLNYLNLDVKLTDRVLVTLSELPVKLSELQLSLRESVFANESLKKLLESHKDSLKNLRFLSMGAKSHFEIVFPTLPNLNLLELHSWDAQISGVTFSKFTYPSNFPALKSLVLHTWVENSSWIQFFPAAYYGSVPTLESLKIPPNFMYPAMIQNLSWLYPNLKSLDLHFSQETQVIIQRVFTHFSEQLEELRIRDSLPREKLDYCLDPLFTGLAQSACDKILRKKLFDPNEDRNKILKLRQKPTLLNLKNLRKLDIEDMLRHETYVTDVTGYLVLLQMPKLRYLHMGRSQIDDECLGHLARKYPCNMQKELLVPKPRPSQRMIKASSKLPNIFLAKMSLLNAYNACSSPSSSSSSTDLINNNSNNCVIS